METKIIENAFDELLKCQYERISESNLKVTLPIQPLFINSVGVIHGGIICSLADIAMGNTFPIDEQNRQTVVTVDLKTSFLKPAKGKYLVAWHPKSSELNERNTVVIKRYQNMILVRQIAGKVARKIVSYTQVGATLTRGEEFGFIKFGSRVDVFLPIETTILVKIGDTVKGGITDIAMFKFK